MESFEMSFKSAVVKDHSMISQPVTDKTSLQPTEEPDVHSPSEQYRTPKTPESVYVEPPYNSPSRCFVYVSFGESSVMVNVNCRKANFTDFLKKKYPVMKDNLDFCDLQGKIVGVQHLGDPEYIVDLFEPDHVYLPCEVFARSGIFTEVKPVVHNWQALYPELAAILSSSTQKGTKDSSNKCEFTTNDGSD